MKILFDQGTPAPLRATLSNHDVKTAFECGWDRLENGELLAAAEADGFEVFVTTDQNLRYQQNLAQRRIAIVVLTTANWPRLRPHAHLVAKAIAALNSTLPPCGEGQGWGYGRQLIRKEHRRYSHPQPRPARGPGVERKL